MRVCEDPVPCHSMGEMDKQPEKFTIHLNKEARGNLVYERLQKIGKEQRRSLSFIVLEAVYQYLESYDKDDSRLGRL